MQDFFKAMRSIFKGRDLQAEFEQSMSQEPLGQAERDRLVGIVLSAMQAVLKEAGFRKKAQVFRRETPESIQFVVLQRHRFSSPGEVDLTLNICSDLNAARHSRSDNLPLTHWAESMVYERIGDYIDGLDRWWTLADEKSASTAANEIAQVLSSTVLPELETIATEKGLRERRSRHRYSVALEEFLDVHR